MVNLIKQDEARLRLFKKYGYDIPKARKFILLKAELSAGKILEVGTGKGHMAAALGKKGLRAVSIDLDRKAQKTARLNLKNLGLDKLILLKNMDAERLEYGDSSFENVIAVNFIHHAKNPLKCLKEMIRVSKNKLIIADLNKKGEKIMEKVHALDGHRHVASKMPMSSVKKYLEGHSLSVKVYRDVCQIIVIATKGEVR